MKLLYFYSYVLIFCQNKSNIIHSTKIQLGYRCLPNIAYHINKIIKVNWLKNKNGDLLRNINLKNKVVSSWKMPNCVIYTASVQNGGQHKEEYLEKKHEKGFYNPKFSLIYDEYMQNTTFANISVTWKTIIAFLCLSTSSYFLFAYIYIYIMQLVEISATVKLSLPIYFDKEYNLRIFRWHTCLIWRWKQQIWITVYIYIYIYIKLI